MNTQAVAALPPETITLAPRAPDTGSGSSFVALLSPPTPPPSAPASAPPSAAPANQASTNQASNDQASNNQAPANQAPADTQQSAATPANGSSALMTSFRLWPHHAATEARKKLDDANTVATAAAAPPPLLQLAPIGGAPAAAGAAAAQSAATATPAVAGLTPSLPAALPPMTLDPSTMAGVATGAPTNTASGAPTLPNAAAALAAATATALPSPAPAPSSAAATPQAAPPAAPSAAAPASGATAFAAMAATLGARVAAGAPALNAPPRVTLADLSASGDKQTTAAPLPPAIHSASTLETLQGLAKPPAAPTATLDAAADDKMLVGQAKDLASAVTAPLDHTADAGTSDTASSAAPAATNDTQASPPPVLAPAPAMPAAAAPAPLAPVMVHAAEQVVLGLRQAVRDGDNHIQIQLQPAELGAVDVKLSVNHDGRVTMVVSADRSDTLNLLRQDSGALTQALRDAGLQADSSSLSFNLRGGTSFQQQASQNGNGSGAGASSADSELNSATLPMASLQRRHAGSLDIHV
jgi:flagellar hook-length control protein FliK